MAAEQELIEARALEVLLAVPRYIWGRGEPGPAVPVEDIADSHFGLRVCEKSFEEMRAAPGCPHIGDEDTLSGLLLPSLGEIWVNAEEAQKWEPRKRFTIAHELGHQVLHLGSQQPLFCRRKAVAEDEREAEGPDIETEASIFAAALLMPAPWIKRFWPKLGRDHGRMCEKFAVSGAAMGRRLHTALP